MKLDIGCGKEWDKDFEGLDKEDFGQKYKYDLEELGKLPIEDNECEYIRIENTIEHITRPTAIKLLNECWRILAKGGHCEITTPNGVHTDIAWQDPTHLSVWVKGTFTEYIAGGRPRNADYGIKQWEMVKYQDHPKDPRIMLIIMTPQK